MDIWQPATADDASSGPAPAAGAPTGVADSSPVPAVSALPVALFVTRGVELGMTKCLFGTVVCDTTLLPVEYYCFLVYPPTGPLAGLNMTMPGQNLLCMQIAQLHIASNLPLLQPHRTPVSAGWFEPLTSGCCLLRSWVRGCMRWTAVAARLAPTSARQNLRRRPRRRRSRRRCGVRVFSKP
jgi:hypothetical protein